MVLPKRTPSWIMCTDGRLSACRPHEELLFKRPPYKYVRSSPTVLFMILARKRFRAFFYRIATGGLGCQIFQMCGNRLFWRQKQKKNGENSKRKGVRADKCMIFTLQLIRYRNIFENVLKSGNGRRMDLAFLASF